MKKKIGIFIIILIIIAIILIVIMVNYKKGNIEIYIDEGKSDDITVINGYAVQYPNNTSDCCAVINIAKEYINYLVGEEKEILLNVVSSDYIRDESISENNIIEKTKDSSIQYSENYEVILNEIYMIEESERIQTYLMDVLYYNKEDNQKYNTKLMVQIDGVNGTYQIIPYQYMLQKGYHNLKIGDLCDTGVTSIENKEDNVYYLTPISESNMAERYFNLYLTYLEYDKEQSYYLLNKEYREKRFDSIEDYLSYINKIKLDNTIIEKYQVNDYDDYIQYVCIDNNGNYYIFNETNTMNFELILDTYTIDIPQFTEKYNSATDQQKVALNIDKFMQAINSKDYKYAYGCLADSFKNNYFKTQADFENYAKENFYASNTVGYKEFGTQGEYYTYSVILTDKETEAQKNKTFIMKLGEGTDFVLSFDR